MSEKKIQYSFGTDYKYETYPGAKASDDAGLHLIESRATSVKGGKNALNTSTFNNPIQQTSKSIRGSAKQQPSRPKQREYDRKSGTGRGREMKKHGEGGHNWGGDTTLHSKHLVCLSACPFYTMQSELYIHWVF